VHTAALQAAAVLGQVMYKGQVALHQRHGAAGMVKPSNETLMPGDVSPARPACQRLSPHHILYAYAAQAFTQGAACCCMQPPLPGITVTAAGSEQHEWGNR
jgi:hypothetical protein